MSCCFVFHSGASSLSLLIFSFLYYHILIAQLIEFYDDISTHVCNVYWSCYSLLSTHHHPQHTHIHTVLVPFRFPNMCNILLFLVLLEGEVKNKSWEIWLGVILPPSRISRENLCPSQSHVPWTCCLCLAFLHPRYWRRTLGMQVRYVHHEDYQFCYSFRGRPGHKPSILMLHGFSAHKDMWLSVVKVHFQTLLS